MQTYLKAWYKKDGVNEIIDKTCSRSMKHIVCEDTQIHFKLDSTLAYKQMYSQDDR